VMPISIVAPKSMHRKKTRLKASMPKASIVLRRGPEKIASIVTGLSQTNSSHGKTRSSRLRSTKTSTSAMALKKVNEMAPPSAASGRRQVAVACYRGAPSTRSAANQPYRPCGASDT